MLHTVTTGLASLNSNASKRRGGVSNGNAPYLRNVSQLLSPMMKGGVCSAAAISPAVPAASCNATATRRPNRLQHGSDFFAMTDEDLPLLALIYLPQKNTKADISREKFRLCG
jgi:hypothetical protein